MRLLQGAAGSSYGDAVDEQCAKAPRLEAKGKHMIASPDWSLDVLADERSWIFCQMRHSETERLWFEHRVDLAGRIHPPPPIGFATAYQEYQEPSVRQKEALTIFLEDFKCLSQESNVLQRGDGCFRSHNRKENCA